MSILSERQDYTEHFGIEVDNFKPLGTIKVAFFQFIVTCSLEILVVVLFFTKESPQNACGQIVVMLFSQTALWILSLIFDDYFRSKHYLIRLAGHFTQQKRLNKLSSVFVFIISFGNALVLCTVGILLQINSGSVCAYNEYVSPTFILFCIFSIEIVLLIPNFVNYMMSVYSFNNIRPLSDIDKYECWFSVDNQARSEVGFRLDSDAVTAFLEKQADLIHYYKVANNDLSKRLEEIQTTVLDSQNKNT